MTRALSSVALPSANWIWREALRGQELLGFADRLALTSGIGPVSGCAGPLETFRTIWVSSGFLPSGFGVWSMT